MQFEWDEAKNLDNIRKHEIDFADVSKMFDSRMLIELDTRFDYGKDRWFGIGFLGNGIAVVVWTERQNNVMRIISTRRANRYERQRLDQYPRTNWTALEAMTDDDIDYSDIPPLTEEFFEKATLRIPANLTHRLVQIDPEVLRWFKAHRTEYQDSINSVLRRYIETDGSSIKAQ